MYDELDWDDRLRLVRFACSFAWADLRVGEGERAAFLAGGGEAERDRRFLSFLTAVGGGGGGGGEGERDLAGFFSFLTTGAGGEGERDFFFSFFTGRGEGERDFFFLGGGEGVRDFFAGEGERACTEHQSALA